jgi:hypothetical protein
VTLNGSSSIKLQGIDKSVSEAHSRTGVGVTNQRFWFKTLLGVALEWTQQYPGARKDDPLTSNNY